MMIAGLNSNLHNVGRGESSVRTLHGFAVVDAQIGLVALMSAEVRDSVLPKIKTLLTDARVSGIPGTYLQHDGAEGYPLETQTEGWELYPSLHPAEWRVRHQKWHRTHFSEPRSNRNLKKEGLLISSLREA